MANKHEPEEIVAKRRQVDVLTSLPLTSETKTDVCARNSHQQQPCNGLWQTSAERGVCRAPTARVGGSVRHKGRRLVRSPATCCLISTSPTS
jgi:hypothetical protein